MRILLLPCAAAFVTPRQRLPALQRRRSLGAVPVKPLATKLGGDAAHRLLPVGSRHPRFEDRVGEHGMADEAIRREDDPPFGGVGVAVEHDRLVCLVGTAVVVTSIQSFVLNVNVSMESF